MIAWIQLQKCYFFSLISLRLLFCQNDSFYNPYPPSLPFQIFAPFPSLYFVYCQGLAFFKGRGKIWGRQKFLPSLRWKSSCRRSADRNGILSKKGKEKKGVKREMRKDTRGWGNEREMKWEGGNIKCCASRDLRIEQWI